MIESRFWKVDLLNYAKKFKPVKNPPKWTEKRHVNFEKDIIVSFFIIRKLAECYKLSSKTLKHKMMIYRIPCIGRVDNFNYSDFEKLYDFNSQEEVGKDVKFVSNQLIHGRALLGHCEKNGNYSGIFMTSDFERQKFLYHIPILEIIKILEIAGNDYPSSLHMVRDEDWEFIVTTN